jgi:hypothetical protein
MMIQARRWNEASEGLLLVRGRVVPFRLSARISVVPPRRPPGFMPGVLIRLDERQASKRPPERSSKTKWSVVGSGATLLLVLVKKILP